MSVMMSGGRAVDANFQSMDTLAAKMHNRHCYMPAHMRSIWPPVQDLQASDTGLEPNQDAATQRESLCALSTSSFPRNSF